MASPPYCTRNTLVAVGGPTGAGKSELAMSMAEHLDGEIVNCDSMQIYRGFDIGTAKQPPSQRRGIPHHLLDIAEPTEIFSASHYATLGREAVRGIGLRGRVPIVVGGTGFYLRALLNGLPDLPPRNEGLRSRLGARNSEHRYRLLKRLDPVAAARLHGNDEARVVRALEIRLMTGYAVPALGAAGALPEFRIRKFVLMPPRKELYELLDRRTERMYREGLVEEVAGLLRAGVPREAKPFEAVGYRQALRVALGEMAEADAVRETQQATRNYAKRQITWFRHDAGTIPIEGFGRAIDLQWLFSRNT